LAVARPERYATAGAIERAWHADAAVHGARKVCQRLDPERSEVARRALDLQS